MGRQECGVKLDMQQQTPQWPEDRLLTIQGEHQSRLRAVQSVLHAMQPDMHLDGTLKMLVSQQDAGAIIGKAGATLKELRQSTGANCQVEKQEIYGERLVTASGPLTAVLALAGS